MTEKEQPQLLDERVISNRGLILWTPDSKYRRFWIQTQLIRPPQTNYVSKKFNPDKSDYANLTYLRRGMVIREDRMEYEKQTFVWDVDICGYLAKYLQCAIADIQSTLRTISTQLGIPTGTGDDIFCEPIQDQFDQIKIVVRVDGALAVQLYGLKYDLNCPEAEQREQPPPPPPEFPRYPRGRDLRDTPTPATEPYNQPNDDGDTSPLPRDVRNDNPGILRVVYNIGANGALEGSAPVTVEYPVPDDSFQAELREAPAPGTCATITNLAVPNPPLQETWIFAPDGREERVYEHRTCNILSIISQEFIPPP